MILIFFVFSEVDCTVKGLKGVVADGQKFGEVENLCMKQLVFNLWGDFHIGADACQGRAWSFSKDSLPRSRFRLLSSSNNNAAERSISQDSLCNQASISSPSIQFDL